MRTKVLNPKEDHDTPYHVDLASFKVDGDLFVLSVARYSGFLHWAISIAGGSMDNPAKQFCVVTGMFAEPGSEVSLLPFEACKVKLFLKGLKEGRIHTFRHRDAMREKRIEVCSRLLAAVDASS